MRKLTRYQLSFGNGGFGSYVAAKVSHGKSSLRVASGERGNQVNVRTRVFGRPISFSAYSNRFPRLGI